MTWLLHRIQPSNRLSSVLHLTYGCTSSLTDTDHLLAQSYEPEPGLVVQILICGAVMGTCCECCSSKMLSPGSGTVAGVREW